MENEQARKQARKEFVDAAFAPLNKKFQDIKETGGDLIQHLEASHEDELTELLGRKKFLLKVKEKQSEGKGREKEIVGTILFLDIDFFKKINDNYGHNTGDLVLKAVAHHLREVCDKEDIICRWGGEEIIVFFPGENPEEILKKFASEELGKSVINLTVDASEVRDGLQIPVTFSGGIAAVTRGEDLETTIGIADSAMYRVKHDPKDSRNRLEISNQEDLEDASKIRLVA